MTLHAIIDLVYVLEPNLHKVYLLVDQEKLEEMIGIVSSIHAGLNSC